jgi:DNA-binding CsgD family transcriptional regulator
MLPGGYTAVLQAHDRAEFRAAVVGFARQLGFDRVSAIAVFDRAGGASDFINVDNTPEAFSAAYEDPALQKSDPVMQHCRRYSVPIVWNRDTYASAQRDELWEHQAPFGYQTGIAMAVHLPDGYHFQFGVDRDQRLPEDATELQRLVADLQLFAVLAQESARRILVPARPRARQRPRTAGAAVEAPALTPRERDALQWTMHGKTAWEVGAVLGISERTVTFHIQNAMHKLDAVNKRQAVVKAMHLGLIG